MGAELWEGPAGCRGRARKRFAGRMLSFCRFYPALASFGHRTIKVQEGSGVQLRTTTFEHPGLYPVVIRALVWIDHCDFCLSSADLLPVVIPVWQQVP